MKRRTMNQSVCSLAWYGKMHVTIWLLLSMLLAMPAARGQQEPADTPASSSDKGVSRGESLIRWQYFAELPVASGEDSPWYDFHLTPAVFDGARQDLADLRLYDGEQREVSYALRVREAKSKVENMDAEVFNRLKNEDRSWQVSLDLGSSQIQHNEVEILTDRRGFRRRVIIEGSDDRQTWNEIDVEYLMNFPHDGGTFSHTLVNYPPSRFRYLRVTVHPDPVEDRSRDWQIESVTVRHRVEVPGQQVTRRVDHGAREPVRTPRGAGSQWLIALGGTSVPCRELVVQIDSTDFVRDWRVESAGSDRPGAEFQFVASGTWRRKAGEEQTTFVARFPREVRAARLKLLVTDYRNPPLVITSIQARAPARQVVLEANRNVPGPLRLYFGNPEAEAPRYDFARNLPEQLDPPPQRLELKTRLANPAYQPKPKPLTERWPWLVHSVLAGTLLVLAGLIADLGRAALRESEQA